jgi:predicted Mrr-cat superfamily restriction endonuclease
MGIGDLVLVVPKKSDFSGFVLFAEVAGDYRFDASLATDREGYPHQRNVRWIRPRIARTHLPATLDKSIGRHGLTLTELPDGILASHAREKGWLK